jgi:hypothetical protein
MSPINTQQLIKDYDALRISHTKLEAFIKQLEERESSYLMRCSGLEAEVKRLTQELDTKMHCWIDQTEAVSFLKDEVKRLKAAKEVKG